MRRLLPASVAALALAVLAALATADPPPAASVDALPEGAVLRLGTLRATVRTGGGWLALAPDVSTVAATSANERVEIFDVATGDRRASLAVAGVPAAFSPDGRHVAVAVRGAPARCFDVATGEELAAAPPDLAKVLAGRRTWRIPELEAPFVDIGIQPTPMTIVVSDVLTGHEVRAITGSFSEWPLVDLSPDGKRLAVLDGRGLTLFDVDTGERRLEHPTAAQGQPMGLRFSADGSLLACAEGDGATHLVDAATGEERGAPLPNGFPDANVVLAFSPDGRTLVRSTDFFVLGAVDLATRTLRWKLPPLGGEATDVVFSADGKIVATCDFDGRVRFWDAAAGKELHARGGHQGRIVSVACSPTADVVATAGRDRTVRIWDLASGEKVSIVRLPLPQGTHEVRAGGVDDVGRVAAIAWSPKGDRLAVAGDSVCLLDPQTGAEAWVLQSPQQAGASSAALSADGKLLVAAGTAPETRAPEHPTVRLWDLASGGVRLEIPSQTWALAAFSPDGTTLATSSYDVLRLHDPGTGAVRSTIEGVRGCIYAIAFSPDGKCLVSGEDGRVRVFDAQTLEERWSGAYSTPIAFSPDGRTLACCTPVQPAAILLLDAATGAVRKELSREGSSVTALAFSRDGRRLVSGHIDGTALVWDVAPIGTGPR